MKYNILLLYTRSATLRLFSFMFFIAPGLVVSYFGHGLILVGLQDEI